MHKLTLYCGDPHVTVSNLEESEKLMHFIQGLILDKKIEKLVFLGDQMHTHAVLRAEVVDFWIFWLDIFSDLLQTRVLVGNHDFSNHKTDSVHSMQAFKLFKRKNLTIIDSLLLEDNILYLPYMHDKQKFVELANSYSDKANTLVCHADWDGAQYENGFYCPDGIKQEDVKFNLIIGGHIHKRSRFGKIILPGTARWLTSSDANEPKGLWLVNHNDDGSIEKEEFISTEKVCTPIISLVWEEGQDKPEIPENSRVSIELIGSSDWVSKQKSTLKGKVSIKTKITDQRRKLDRKNSKSFDQYLLNLYESKIDKQKMYDFAKEIGIV